jgi:hypothetical protein
VKTYEIKDMSEMPDALQEAKYLYGKACIEGSIGDISNSGRILNCCIKQYAADEANRLLRDSQEQSDDPA